MRKINLKTNKPFDRADKKNYSPQKIILYGSVAKNKATKDSDIEAVDMAEKIMNFIKIGTVAKYYFCHYPT